MVREGRVLTSTSGKPTFGAGYYVQALEVGAQVTAASSGATVTVAAGHGFAAGDKYMNGLNTQSFSGTNTVESVDATHLYLESSYSVAEGDLLVNLADDSGSIAPSYDGAGLTVYTDMDYQNAAITNTVLTDSEGRYRYWHKGIAIWELVRSASVPAYIYTDAVVPGDEDQVNYGVRYAHLFADGGTGSEDDPWTTTGTNPVQAAYDDLPAAGVGGGGIVRMIPGCYDLGSDDVGVLIAHDADFLLGVTIEGYSYGVKSSSSATVRNEGAVVLMYSGTGAAIKIGHFATTNTYWAEGVTLRGFKLRQTGTAGTGIGILARLFRYSRIEDVTINSFETGIGLATVSDFNILDNLRIHSNTADGLHIGRTTDENGDALLTPNGQCNANRITNCDFRNTARDNGATAYGLRISNNGVGNIIKNSEFHDFDTADYGAILISGSSSDDTSTVVDSNYFEGNYYACKHNNPASSGTDMAGIAFTNNFVTQMEGYGVWVNSGSTGSTYGVVVTGNVFNQPLATAPYDTAVAVQLGTYVLGAHIAGNVYKVQDPLGYTLPGDNVNHGALGSITQDEITIGTKRVTGAVTFNSTLAVTGDASMGNILCATIATTGNSTFGNASTDTTTNLGRLIVRTIASDPTGGGGAAGTIGEVVYSSSTAKFYGKHTTSATDTNWRLMGT
jgi:hypothetical protein